MLAATRQACRAANCRQPLQAPVAYCPFCGSPQVRQESPRRPLSLAEEASPKAPGKVVEVPAAHGPDLELQLEPELQPEAIEPHPEAREDVTKTQAPRDAAPAAIQEIAKPPPTPPDGDGEDSQPYVEPSAEQEEQPAWRSSLQKALRILTGLAAGASVVAIVGFVAWRSSSLVDPELGSAPQGVPEDPSPTTTMERIPSPPPSPAKPVDAKLIEAERCLHARDYACSWRATRTVLARNPADKGAAAIERSINEHVDSKIAQAEKALANNQLASAGTFLKEAEAARDFSIRDPRIEEIRRRIDQQSRDRQQQAAATSKRSNPAPARPAKAEPSPTETLVNGLLGDARARLDEGKLDAAESLAAQALKLDAGNQKASQILDEIATEKKRLKELLQANFR